MDHFLTVQESDAIVYKGDRGKGRGGEGRGGRERGNVISTIDSLGHSVKITVDFISY